MMSLQHMTIKSESLRGNVDLDVILPEAPKHLIGMVNRAEETYPTLYLLHGMSDDHTIWQRRTSIERYAADKGIAVVMPCVDLSWYTNMKYGEKYWTYISEELPAIMRAFFPRMSRRREDTFVAGLSMGGYGAVKCGLRASDTFSYAAGLSGAVDVVRILQDTQGEDGTYWKDIFGTAEEARGGFDDLMAAAHELAKEDKRKVKFYIWCGTEDFLYQDNIRMRDHMNALGLDLTYEESPGDHAWQYWDAKIQTVLDWLPLRKEVK